MKHAEREAYLSSYPKLQKWLNTCVCCGAVGYKPEMPPALTTRLARGETETRGAQNLRRFYSPLKVNEQGLCETCEKRFAKKK